MYISYRICWKLYPFESVHSSALGIVFIYTLDQRVNTIVPIALRMFFFSSSKVLGLDS
jgi:hypothetical protein